MQPAASTSDDPITSAESSADSPASRRRRGGGQDSATSAAKARLSAARGRRGLLAVRRTVEIEGAAALQLLGQGRTTTFAAQATQGRPIQYSRLCSKKLDRQTVKTRTYPGYPHDLAYWAAPTGELRTCTLDSQRVATSGSQVGRNSSARRSAPAEEVLCFLSPLGCPHARLARVMRVSARPTDTPSGHCMHMVIWYPTA